MVHSVTRPPQQSYHRWHPGPPSVLPSRNSSSHDPRIHFFACREFGESDRDYARKYDGDLSRFVIFVSGPTSVFDAEYSLQRHTRRSTLCSWSSVLRLSPMSNQSSNWIQTRLLPPTCESSPSLWAVQALLQFKFQLRQLDQTSPHACNSPSSTLCKCRNLAFHRISCDAPEIVGQSISSSP